MITVQFARQSDAQECDPGKAQTEDRTPTRSSDNQDRRSQRSAVVEFNDILVR